MSREIPSVLILISSMGVLYFGGAWMIGHLTGFMRSIYSRSATIDFMPETANFMLWEIFRLILVVLSPLMLVIIIAGVIGNVSQIGFLITGEKLTPKFDKLNPVKGFKRLLSLRSLVEVIKSVFKLIIIGGISYLVVQNHLKLIPGLMQLSVGQILVFIGQVSFKMFFYCCLVLIVLAALDYLYTRWQHEKDLKMTKQEVKDEYKQREGDPAVRARIKTIQREMARKRMMEAVPEATVVITNPTHLAIAIKYEEGMHAPTILAKGAGHIAEKIRQIAKENDIPVIEEKPLAQTLFKTAEIGDFIPANLYRAVAEILAYVYRLKAML